MVYLSTILASMSEVQRQTYYLACAKAALAAYDLGPLSIHFVQHNAGIVYCLNDNDGAALSAEDPRKCRGRVGGHAGPVACTNSVASGIDR